MGEHVASKAFVTLGMFIIDEFSFRDENGIPTGRTLPPQESNDNILLTLSNLLDFTDWRRRNLCSDRGTYMVLYACKLCDTGLKETTIWYRLSPNKIGMIVDTGHDFPKDIEEKLRSYGSEMWLFRDQPSRGTTRSLNSYRGDHRG